MRSIITKFFFHFTLKGLTVTGEECSKFQFRTKMCLFGFTMLYEQLRIGTGPSGQVQVDFSQPEPNLNETG